MLNLLQVFKYCARYQWLAIGTLLCAIIATIAGLFYPVMTGKVINEIEALNGTTNVSLENKVSTIYWMIGGLALAYLIQNLFNSLRIILNNYFEQGVIYELRMDLYNHMQRLPLGWFDNKATGDLMTHVTEDVTSMERVLVDGIEQGVTSSLQIIGAILILVWIDWWVALWALAPFPFIGLGVYYYTSTAYPRYSGVRKAVSAMNAVLLDNLQGIAQIKAFTREHQATDHFGSLAQTVRQTSLRVMKAWAIYSPSMDFLGALGPVLVLIVGGPLVLQGQLKAGDLVTFILMVSFIYEPIRRLHMLNQLIQSGRAAADRVANILNTVPESYEPKSIQPLPARKPGGREVTFDSVGFQYEDDRDVLENIHITAERGKTIALVGPTGAGKSSIVGLIPRFYEVQTGCVTIDGVSVNDISLKELRSDVGVVSQEAFLFNDTVRQNLLLGDPHSTDESIWAALEAANAKAFVEALPEQLETVVGERGVKLSVGEKQRLSIARALLKDPPVLILDEATASVDTATERLIQQALDRLLQKRTSFVIAHRLSTVRNADCICVIRHGKIIERGTHDELIKLDGTYAHLCRQQQTNLEQSSAGQRQEETIEKAFEQLEG